MFTGMIAAVGILKTATPVGNGIRLAMDAGGWDLRDVAIGDSIAVNGVCLTVAALAPPLLSFDVSQETLDCTLGFAAGAQVNLEKALRLADRLGGHLVSGHVDGVGVVTQLAAAGDNRLLAVEAPRELARYIARKGSIAINGVSLTVNVVSKNVFEVNLIPHTLRETNLGLLKVGARVNLEVDFLARYAERLAEFKN